MTEETVLTLLHICLTTTNHEEALEAANTLGISDLSDLSKLQNEVLNQIRIAVKSPNFVADLKGFRFLSKVMAANHPMIKSIHFATLSVMDKIPSERHTCYYAKMYVRAWDLCSSRGRQEIEMVCIRDLARRLVGLNRNDEAYLLGDFNKRLFIIMDYFFGKCARSAEVAQMMSDAFEDLVLPHLQTPNAIWRCNAADALFVAHPLERPGLDAQAKLDFLEKQHSAMLTLLTDPSHYVRYVAVRGVCDVLSKYWALVSTDKRRALFQCLGERANDGDWRVRQQLFCCFRELISSPPASAVLAELLPELRNNFHDVHRLVRLEYIRLLICIKEKATFPFYHAVSLDHLVARLGVEDVEENLEGLVKILLPYFCPLEETPESIFKRIFALYHMNRKATWKLFLHSKGILKADEAKKFVYCVLKKVHEDAQTATAAGLGSRGRSRVGSKRGSRRGSTSNRNARTGRSVNSRPCPSPGEQTGTDTDNTAALLEIVSVLLKSGVLRDCEEEEFNELLTTLQQMLPDITDAFVDTAAQPALSILHCISGGPAQLADAMVAVRTASIDTAPFTIALHADTIIDQGRAPELVAMLVEAFITFVWGRSQGRADPEESGGRPRFLHTNAGMPDPKAAIAMLQALLLNPKQRIKC